MEQSGVDLARPPVHQPATHIHTHVFRAQPGAQPIGARVQPPAAVGGVCRRTLMPQLQPVQAPHHSHSDLS